MANQGVEGVRVGRRKLDLRHVGGSLQLIAVSLQG